MKVLFLAWRDLAHPNAGGSEVVVDRLARELQARGHEVALICGGPVEPRAYNVVDAGGTFSQYLRSPWLARRFKDHDVVVDVVNGVGFSTPLWWQGPRVCLFHHVHAGQWKAHFPGPVASAGWYFERNLLPRLYRSTEFLTISRSTESELIGLGVSADLIHLLSLGLDDHLLVPPLPKSESPLFLVIGRLQPNKGTGRVLDAWEAVQPQTGGTLAIVGGGPEREELEARGLQGVEWLGRVPDDRKRELLGAAWLLIHGAYREGWGLVIVEAASQGTPAVAFDAPGVRDAVVNGETGLLESDVRAVASSWVALCEDHERRGAMGRAARTRALQFTWGRAAEALVLAVERAIELTPPRRRSSRSR